MPALPCCQLLAALCRVNILVFYLFPSTELIKVGHIGDQSTYTTNTMSTKQHEKFERQQQSDRRSVDSEECVYVD